MKTMWIYTVIPIIYIICFAYVGGGFRKAARHLNHSFLSALQIEDESVRVALMVIFFANIFAALITVSDRMSSTAGDGYLLREGYGGSSYTENLEVSIAGDEKTVEIRVDPRVYREHEKEEIIDRAAAELPSSILGDQPAGHVSRDLSLTDSFEETPIVISYITDRPDILDWDGKICEGIPEGGTDITLSACIEWGELEREVKIPLTVFPKELSETEAFNRRIQEAVETVSSAEEEKLILPEQIDGEGVTWKPTESGAGLIVLFLGLIFSALFLYSKIQNREIRELKNREEMLYDYPHLVNKLVLLLGAGMSMRAAFEKTADDYRLSLRDGGKKRQGFEEIACVCAEMEKGVAEIDAYRNMGSRSSEPKYRTFSTLIVQNMRKGGGELTRQLAKEAEEAFEERKKRARIMGEQAGTKLMFPMMLMLMVVFAVLMVPALVSFG